MKIHMCVDIRGLLEMHRRKKIRIMQHDDGRRMTDSEARDYLYKALGEGKEFLPCSSECDNFDYKKGCLGHNE
jgi:hypothetical protein